MTVKGLKKKEERSMKRGKRGLLLGVEDTADAKQQRTKGQKNDVDNVNNRFVGRFSFVMSAVSATPRRSQF